MSSQTTWIETTFNGDGHEAMQRILASKASGQLVLNVSQGKLCSVVWREKLVDRLDTERGQKNSLDKAVSP